MKRILLIEDDRDLNKGLAYDLELYEYRVYPAYTLAEGMALLDEKGADLILLDGSLPDGDGFDFCRAVKGECGIPVIFLTARDMEQDELQGYDGETGRKGTSSDADRVPDLKDPDLQPDGDKAASAGKDMGCIGKLCR